jgi:hypothetical protein
MIDTDLRTHLVELDTAAGVKVYTGNAVQGIPRPFVVIRRSSGDQPLTLRGVGLFHRAQFDVNVITENYTDAYPIANAIRSELHGFRGALGGTGGADIKSCRCVSFPSDQSEIDGDRVIRWVQSSFLFVYSEV